MPSHDARIPLRGAAIPTAVAGVVAIAISTALVGTKGLIGALSATLLVLAFFSFGQVALDRLTRNNPQIMMAAALLVYTTQILLVAIVLAVFKNTTLFDTKVFGFTLLGCALIWTGFQVRGAMKAKLYYVQPDSGTDKNSKSERQQ
jgi:ATP synthase protein I